MDIWYVTVELGGRGVCRWQHLTNTVPCCATHPLMILNYIIQLIVNLSWHYLFIIEINLLLHVRHLDHILIFKVVLFDLFKNALKFGSVLFFHNLNITKTLINNPAFVFCKPWIISVFKPRVAEEKLSHLSTKLRSILKRLKLFYIVWFVKDYHGRTILLTDPGFNNSESGTFGALVVLSLSFWTNWSWAFCFNSKFWALNFHANFIAACNSRYAWLFWAWTSNWLFTVCVLADSSAFAILIFLISIEYFSWTWYRTCWLKPYTFSQWRSFICIY